MSGDELVILCEDLAHVGDAFNLAKRVDEAFATPFDLTGARVTITVSVGVAPSGPGEAVTEELITHADRAMCRAKGLGGATHQLVGRTGRDIAGDRDRLERDLCTALSRGQLDLATSRS